MTRRLFVATNNAGKLKEFRRLFGESLGLEILSPSDLGITHDVVEDGVTFEANATKKAREFAALTGLMTLADDSGLEVDYLDGAPGVYSARYADGKGDAANNEKLLGAMQGVADEERTARFRCVLALVDHAGPMGDGVYLVPGVCEGRIAHEERGSEGFGYDPLFIPQGEARMMAELTPAEKDARSHRAQASQRMHTFLTKYLA